jgi:hypothetical protein
MEADKPKRVSDRTKKIILEAFNQGRLSPFLTSSLVMLLD